MLSRSELHTAYRRLGEHLDQVDSLMEAVDRGCPTYTAAVIERTVNAAASASTTLASDLGAIMSECRKKVSAKDPRSWPRLPQMPRPLPGIPTGHVKTVSPAGAA